MKKAFMQKKAEKLSNLFVLLALNLICLLPAIFYYKPHMSVDSYGILLNGEQCHIESFIGALRYFGAFVYKIVTLFNHNPLINPLPDIVFFVFSVALIVALLSKIIYTDLIKTGSLPILFLIDLSVLLSFENVWFCEMLTFPECISLTAVGCVLCFSALIIYIKIKSPVRYLLSGVLLICATAIYQQFIVVFTIYIIGIACVMAVKENISSFKQLFLLYIKPAVMIVVCGVIYFGVGTLLIKVFHLQMNERVSFGISNIIENIKYFILRQHSFLKGRGYFDTEILTICYLVIGLLFFITVISEWKKHRNTLKSIVILVSYSFGYAVSFFLGIVSTSHAARAMFGLFSVFFMFSIGIIVLSDKKVISSVALVLVALLIPVNGMKIYESRNTQLEANAFEEEYANRIFEVINQYDNKDKIKYIAIASDSIGDIDDPSVYADYCFKNMLSLKAEKENQTFEFIQMPDDVYAKYFAENNMTDFNAEEQIIFDGDTVYICRY